MTNTDRVKLEIRNSQLPGAVVDGYVRRRTSLDWRWQVARYLYDHGIGPSRSRDDEETATALAFLRARQSRDAGAFERLQRDFPHLYTAYCIYEDSEGWERCLLEASLLCHNPEPEAVHIGNFMGIEAEAVVSYERIFYNVRNFLYAPGWIAANVINPAYSNALTKEEGRNVSHKILAYNCGWEIYTAYCTGKALTRKQKAMVDSLIGSDVRRNMHIAGILHPIDRWTVSGVCDAYYNERKVAVAETYAIGSTEDRENEEVASRALSIGEFRKLTELPDSDTILVNGHEPRVLETIRKSHEEFDGGS